MSWELIDQKRSPSVSPLFFSRGMQTGTLTSEVEKAKLPTSQHLFAVKLYSNNTKMESEVPPLWWLPGTKVSVMWNEGKGKLDPNWSISLNPSGCYTLEWFSEGLPEKVGLVLTLPVPLWYQDSPNLFSETEVDYLLSDDSLLFSFVQPEETVFSKLKAIWRTLFKVKRQKTLVIQSAWSSLS